MTPPGTQRHTPVLCKEVVNALALKSEGIYVDGTFGQGGYCNAILEANSDCNVIGIDRDDVAVSVGRDLEKKYPDRFKMLKGRFSQMQSLLTAIDIDKVNGIALDLGVSSPQLDEAERGFSFQKEGPLDMRMGDSEETAEDVVNGYTEAEIAEIIYKYGEERHSRRIARRIVDARKESRITTTLALAKIVEGAVGRSSHKIHPATRTFQALRIHVNRELEELETVLRLSEQILAPEGRLAVVTFHSLEDRIVKRYFKSKSEAPSVSRHLPDLPDQPKPNFKIITKKPTLPTEEEMSLNPRSRSAKLRVAEKLETDAGGRHEI